MLDSLYLDHREIQLSPSRNVLTADHLKRAKEFARFPSATIAQHLLEIAKDTETLVLVFELYLKTTSTQYLSQISPIERLICELIQLNKLQGQFSSAVPSGKERHASDVLGMMLRQRLTYFFLNLDPKYTMQVHQLGNEHGMREVAWKEAVSEAAAIARTIANFLAVSNCYVFLATIEESLRFGVDLIIITDNFDNWCVSVKPGADKGEFYAECVINRPQPMHDDYVSAMRGMIYVGAKHMSDLYGETLRACRVLVGKTSGEAVDMNLYPQDVTRLTSFITRKRPQARAQKDEAA